MVRIEQKYQDSFHRLQQIPNLFNNNISIFLDDVYVPLRSNLKLCIDVKNDSLSTLSIRSFEKDIISADRKEIIGGKSLDQTYLQPLFDNIEAYIRNKSDRIAGVRLNKRPLVASPVWSNGRKENFAYIEVSSAIALFKNVVLLAPPGAGKSTIAKKIACLHYRRFYNKDENEVPSFWDFRKEKLNPVFVEVKSLVASAVFPGIEDSAFAADERIYLNYLKTVILNNNQAEYDYILEQLNKGNGLLIFDGLDEIKLSHYDNNTLEKRRDQIRNLIRCLAERFPLCKVVVTSRPAGYSSWSLKDFETIEIMPVDEDESKMLIASFLKVFSNRSVSEDEVNVLVRHLKSVPNNLREQPLFILLLSFLHQQHPSHPLPVERGDLLNHSISVLLTSWTLRNTKEKNLLTYLGCDKDRMIKCLENIAYESLQASERSKEADSQDIDLGLILVELYNLGATVDMHKTLAYISENAGILYSDKPNNYRFTHRLFQEYLSASHISKKQNFVKLIVERLYGAFQIWQEVALLVVSILKRQGNELQIWQLLYQLCKSRKPDLIWLSAKIINEHKLQHNDEMITVIVDQLRDEYIQELNKKENLHLMKREDIAMALGQIGDSRRGIGVGRDGLPDIAWMKVEGNAFVMGSTAEDITLLKENLHSDWQFQRETPAFEPVVAPFEISIYPITIIQFNAFVDATDGYYSDQWWTNAGLAWRLKNGPPDNGLLSSNCPRNYVTWYEAASFASWLGSKMGRLIRLPTETEWEAAAKGSNNSIFPWGNSFDTGRCNSREAGIHRVIPVGCFSETSWPADMVGNVWEWCSSIVQKDNFLYRYPLDSGDDFQRERMDLGDEAMRGTRGGHYLSDLSMARCSYRGRDIPSARYSRQGFRIVREL